MNIYIYNTVRIHLTKYETIGNGVGLEDRYKMGLTGSFKGCSSFPFLKMVDK